MVTYSFLYEMTPIYMGDNNENERIAYPESVPICLKWLGLQLYFYFLFTIELSTSEKLPGVHIDNTLSWTSQVENTIKKCNSLLYLLSRIKYYLSIPIRKPFYNAYILPHLNYCCTVWGIASSDLLDSVIKFQKPAARCILDKDIEIPSAEMFTELKWMKFLDKVQYQKAVMMYKFFTI